MIKVHDRCDNEVPKDDEALSHPRPARKKKPYRAPELIEYGNVTQLTAGFAGSAMDGGSGRARPAHNDR